MVAIDYTIAILSLYMYSHASDPERCVNLHAARQAAELTGSGHFDADGFVCVALCKESALFTNRSGLFAGGLRTLSKAAPRKEN